jgi:[lysine-biosynthesis-protein LysW]--L-2-aminoadipate ligase
VKIGLLHSLIRKEEKLLIEAFQKAGVEPIMIDDRKLIMDFHSAPDIDILVERSINHSQAPGYVVSTRTRSHRSVVTSC